MAPPTRSAPRRALRRGVIALAMVAVGAAARDWIIRHNDRRNPAGADRG